MVVSCDLLQSDSPADSLVERAMVAIACSACSASTGGAPGPGAAGASDTLLVTAAILPPDLPAFFPGELDIEEI